MYERKFMELAEDEALNHDFKDGGPFGAVIVFHYAKHEKIVIAKAHNEVLKDKDPTAHAEIRAIRKACKIMNSHDLSGCELYTSAYPCPMCLGAIIWSNIKKVYYGNSAKDAANIGFRDDAIYKFLAGKNKMLHLEQHDRDLTIKSFKAFKNQDGQLY